MRRKKPSGKKAFILEINVLLTRTSKDDIMLDCRKLGNTVKMILKLSWLVVWLKKSFETSHLNEKIITTAFG